MTSKERIAVVVLGMHRSGTSAFARVLNLMGCDLPANLMPPSKGNVKGHFEPQLVYRFNNELLEIFNSDWKDFRKVRFDTLPEIRLRELRIEARNVLKQEFGESSFFVLKDPRMCKLLPFWLDVFKDEGVSARFILPLRSPLEIAQSLYSRNHIHLEWTWLLWLRHMLEAEEFSRGFPRCFVSYSDLLTGHQEVISSIKRLLNLPLKSLTKSRRAEIESFLDKSLRHHSEESLDSIGEGSLSGWVSSAYAVLHDLKLNDGASDLSHLAAVTEAFEAHCIDHGGLLEALERDRKNFEERHSQLKKGTVASREKIEELEQLKTVNTHKIVELKRVRLVSKEKIEELREQQVESRNTETELLRLRISLAELEKKHEKSVRENVQKQQAESAINSKVEKNFRLERERVAVLSDQLDQRNEDVHELQLKVLSEQQARSSLNVRLDRQAESLSESNNQLQQYKVRLESVSNQSDTSTLRASALEANVAQLSEKIELDRQERIHTGELLEKRTSEVSKTSSDLQQERQKFETQMSKANVLEKENMEHRFRYTQLEIQKAELSSKLKGVVRERQLLLGQQRTQKAAVEHRSELFQYAKQISSLPVRWLFFGLAERETLIRKAFLSSSGFFSEDWYLAVYPDVLGSKDVATHYLQFGGIELRDPHPGFSAKSYVEESGMDLDCGLTPLEHFLIIGNVTPKISEHVPIAFEDPLTRFWSLIFTPDWFNVDWYLGQNDDVKQSDLSAEGHYLNCGAKEGRDPCAMFSDSRYRILNKDVGADVGSLFHYLKHGQFERRPVAPSENYVFNETSEEWKRVVELSTLFEPEWYLEENDDLFPLALDPWEHFVEFGVLEFRSPGPDFDALEYLKANPDLLDANVDPLLHYICFGQFEGRPKVGLDPLPDSETIFASSDGVGDVKLEEVGPWSETSLSLIVLQSPMFDPDWCNQVYGYIDDPVSRYLESKGETDPGPIFSDWYYHAQYPDTSGMHALVHFELHGREEGRLIQNSRFAATNHMGSIESKVEAAEVPFYLEQSALRKTSSPKLIDQLAGKLDEHVDEFSYRIGEGNLQNQPFLKLKEIGIADISVRHGNMMKVRRDKSDGSHLCILQSLDRIEFCGFLEAGTSFVEVRLVNAYEPVWLCSFGEELGFLGKSMIAFPSLCRGGIHDVELFGPGSEQYPDILVTKSMAFIECFRSRVGDQFVLNICIDHANGTEPVFNPDFLDWLVGLGVQTSLCWISNNVPAERLEYFEHLSRMHGLKWLGSCDQRDCLQANEIPSLQWLCGASCDHYVRQPENLGRVLRISSKNLGSDIGRILSGKPLALRPYPFQHTSDYVANSQDDPINVSLVVLATGSSSPDAVLYAMSRQRNVRLREVLVLASEKTEVSAAGLLRFCDQVKLLKPDSESTSIRAINEFVLSCHESVPVVIESDVRIPLPDTIASLREGFADSIMLSPLNYEVEIHKGETRIHPGAATLCVQRDGLKLKLVPADLDVLPAYKDFYPVAAVQPGLVLLNPHLIAEIGGLDDNKETIEKAFIDLSLRGCMHGLPSLLRRDRSTTRGYRSDSDRITFQEVDALEHVQVSTLSMELF